MQVLKCEKCGKVLSHSYNRDGHYEEYYLVCPQCWLEEWYEDGEEREEES